MKQKQYLGVSTHPRVCGFASKNIYKCARYGTKGILYDMPNNRTCNKFHRIYSNPEEYADLIGRW